MYLWLIACLVSTVVLRHLNGDTSNLKETSQILLQEVQCQTKIVAFASGDQNFCGRQKNIGLHDLLTCHRLMMIDDPEIKTVKLVNMITPHVSHCISTFIQHYSTWKRLIKATAWMIRFKQYIMWNFSGKSSHPHPSCSLLTVKETDAASLDIVRFAQREVFPEVRNMLKDDDAFPNVTRQGSSIARTLCAN